MIKIVDIDSLFDKYISDFVYKNIGKVKPDEIENQIPELYKKFGQEKLKELDGKSPEEFYREYSGEELVECLKTHIQQGVAISDFLCETITENKENERSLIKALDEESQEEFILYVMNMLCDMDSKNCATKFLEMVLWDYSEPIKELATEFLKERADSVKEEILTQFRESSDETKEYLTEILSGSAKDDRVFDVLIEQFAKNENKIPIYAGYLAKYGDDRALPFLLAQIEKEKIPYADFEELRFAIEALGGEYNKERDFKSDKSYKKIKGLDKKETLKN